MTATRNMQTKLAILISLVAFMQAQQCLERTFESLLEQTPHLEQKIFATPGLSGSFDFKYYEQVKKQFTRNVVSLLNNMTLPDFKINNGYLNQNKLKIKPTTDITFQAIESENALLFQLKNLNANLKVRDFYYSLSIIPIRGYLDVTMAGVLLKVKVQFKKILLNGRLLPQIQIPECMFEIDMSQIKFEFGGGFLLSLADIIAPLIKGLFKGPIERAVYDYIYGIPNKFNNFVVKSQGYFNLGDNMPGSFPAKSPYSSITLDFQLDDDIRVKEERLEFGINGTFFNRDRGYKVPPGLKQPMIPMFDENIPAEFQIFISNYALESFAGAFLEKKPLGFDLLATKLNNPVATFETNTFEGVFPFLTSKFGKNVPTDLILKIKKIYAVQTSDDNSTFENGQTHQGLLSVKVDALCDARLNYPGGSNKIVGTAEWLETSVKVNIKETNGTIFQVAVLSTNITKQFVNTTYEPRFQSSPWVINTALKFILEIVNTDVLSKLKFDLADYTFNIFRFNQTQLNYNVGYLSFVFSPVILNNTYPKLKSVGGNQYLSEYIEKLSFTSEEDENSDLSSPIEPHLIAMMEENERRYQELIRSNQELFEQEQAKQRAALLNYPLLIDYERNKYSPTF